MSSVRRVGRAGHGSLAITLPADWAARSGVVPGALVEVADSGDGSLRVSLAPSGARASYVNTHPALAVPCPTCGMGVDVGTYVRRTSYRAKFCKHADAIHPELDEEQRKRLADRFAEDSVRMVQGELP